MSAPTIECAVIGEQDVGDHVIFLGQVIQYAYEQASPLLFLNGKYIQAADLVAPPLVGRAFEPSACAA